MTSLATDTLTPLPVAVPEARTLRSYDELPYPPYIYEETDPGRLGATGRLFGLAAAPARNCRMLEIGCAQGANLLAWAKRYPESTFVGVDLGQRHIEIARRTAMREECSNAQFLHVDFQEMDHGELGDFDYIVAHGIYSWVSPGVQQALMFAVRQFLAPHGVAYVSFNCLPGWGMRGTLRSILGYHTRGLRSDREKVREAKHFSRFLAEGMLDKKNPLAIYMNWELKQIEEAGESYLAHEMFEAENHPCFFHEFVEGAGTAQLQYLADAQFGRFLFDRLHESARAAIAEYASDPLAREQYADFLVSRMFRRCLLCRDERKLYEQPEPALLPMMRITTTIVPAEQGASLVHGEKVTFRAPDFSFEAEAAVEKALLVILAEAREKTLAFRDLVRRVWYRLEITDARERKQAEAAVAEIILCCHQNDLMRLTTA